MTPTKADLERWAADDSLCGATISETRDLARELLDARQELAALEQCLTEQRERAKKAEARVGEFRTAAARLCWRLNTGEMLMGEPVHDAFMALSALVSDAPAVGGETIESLRAERDDNERLLRREALERARFHKALMQIGQWDCINPPAPGTDFPWLRRIVDDALVGGFFAKPPNPPAPEPEGEGILAWVSKPANAAKVLAAMPAPKPEAPEPPASEYAKPYIREDDLKHWASGATLVLTTMQGRDLARAILYERAASDARVREAYERAARLADVEIAPSFGNRIRALANGGAK